MAGSVTEQYPWVTDEQWLELPWVKKYSHPWYLEVAKATAEVHGLTQAQASADLAIALYLQRAKENPHYGWAGAALDSELTWDTTPQRHEFWVGVMRRLRNDLTS